MLDSWQGSKRKHVLYKKEERAEEGRDGGGRLNSLVTKTCVVTQDMKQVPVLANPHNQQTAMLHTAVRPYGYGNAIVNADVR